nr:MAG TPA: hypothetical protein [Bacteriophage sp.]
MKIGVDISVATIYHLCSNKKGASMWLLRKAGLFQRIQKTICFG